VRVLSLVGGESTGKSTLAIRLGEALPAVVVDETLRRFVAERRRVPTADEQSVVMATQIAREADARREAAAAGLGWVISDGGALMTAVYSILYYHDDSLLGPALDHHRGCALTVLCDADFTWHSDEGQRDGPQARDEAQRILIGLLAGGGVEHLTASGSVEQRVTAVLAAPAVRSRRSTGWSSNPHGSRR
jgi:nicotinamide riboside kinase